MNIIDYIKTLLPRFGKDRVIEDARMIIAELENVTVPTWKTASEVLGDYKFKSKEMRDYERVFERIVKNSRFGLIPTIADTLENTVKVFKVLEDKAEKTFEEDILADGITLQKATILRSLEAVRFMSEYSLLFLNYLYIEETGAVGAKNYNAKTELSKAELDYIDENFAQFCATINVFEQSVDKFKNKLDSIPDLVVSLDASDMVFSTFGESKINPLGFAYTVNGFNKNPIYHVGLVVAEYQANKYKRNVELKRVLELRLLNLQRLQKGDVQDAKLEKEINWIQSRVQRLDHDIKKAEEK